MKVIKFGGSSMADAKQLKKVSNIILSDPERRIVVVSAPGKRNSSDTKVTDLLIALANAVRDDIPENTEKALWAVTDRFASIARDLNLSRDIITVIRKDLENRIKSYSGNFDKFLDCMKAAGEDNSAKLFAYYLKSKGVNAEYVNPLDAGLYLTDEFGNAMVLEESYELLKRLKDKKSIVVFPGFFGYSKAGDIVTFSRGGSDVTGAILAAATDADVYENFTDVDFVYAASPKIVDNPFPIPLFTYEEMRELAYAGFSVLHEDALAPVYVKKIPVNIRNTNNPDAPGTFIVADSKAPKSTFPVVGIAGDTGFLTLHVYKYMMNKEIGFGRRLLSILEDEGISYEHMPSGIDSISVIIRSRFADESKMNRVMEKIRTQLHVDTVDTEYNQAIIMLVGRGMTKSVGIAARAAGAFNSSGINIKMINQGSSEVSIMFGVDECDVKNAVRALYNEFFN